MMHIRVVDVEHDRALLSDGLVQSGPPFSLAQPVQKQYHGPVARFGRGIEVKLPLNLLVRLEPTSINQVLGHRH
jgi:hypothetical protein